MCRRLVNTHFLLITYITTLFSTCDTTVQQISIPPVHYSHVEEFLNRANQRMEEVYTKFNKNIYDKGATQVPGSPAWYMAISHSIKPEMMNASHTSLIVEEATRYMAETYSLSKEQIVFGLSEMDISYTTMSRLCPVSFDQPCKAKRYRAFSGYCNNVQNPRWGNANTKYARLLMPAYEDGISLPRGGGVASRVTLPGAREVSLAIHSDRDKQHDYLSAITVIWGQFVAHDMAYTPFAFGYNGAKLKCCGVNFNEFHPECFPIKLSENDHRTSDHRERCQEFIRSASAVRTGCTLGPREQLNQATSFLDASHIYGNSRSESVRLREFVSGRLRMQISNGESLMPEMDNTDCRNNGTDFHCFHTGDIRANENVGLAALYNLWYKEHNRIATGLSHINPHWNDETIYQETRRIVSAEIQHITYDEFLPTILSQNIIDKYDLKLEKSGYFNGYKINTNPSVVNSAPHAAMRFVASLMPEVLILPSSRRKRETVRLPGTFYAPFELYKNDGYERILIGLLQSSTQKDDSIINQIMTNDMFKDSGYKGYGLDLAAQIIQRGRDHGLPSYTEWRKYCGLKTVSSFQDLTGITTPKIKNIIQKLYRDVSDIDLFTGGLSEISMLGSVVGPTFSCLLGHQFKISRIGDRHWYENNIPPSAFQLKQLAEIRKTTLVKLICANSRMEALQPKVFLKSDYYLNEKMPCARFEDIDLTQWKHDASQIIMDPNVLKSILAQAKKDILQIYEHEIKDQANANINSPIVTAFKFSRPKRQATIIANTSLLLQLASARIVENFIESFQDQESKIRIMENHKFKQFMDTLPEIDLTNILDIPENVQCSEPEIPCDYTTKFRSITGRCNNLNNPEFGESMRPFNRLLSPIYDDGIGSPRQTSVTGSSLPSARLISTHLHPDLSSPHKRYSLMFMQLAQIVDHDLTHTPVNVKHIGPGVLDCSPCKTTPSGCIPIPVPEEDTFYPKIDPITNRPKCIPVTRSLPSRLTLGYREQMNQVTAYLDCSFIYGSDVCEARDLRLFFGGKLNMTERVNSKSLMPETVSNPECRSQSKVCFRAGYDPNCDATLVNEFSAAAYRFGHSLLRPVFKRMNNRHISEEPEVRLRDHFFNPALLYHGHMVDELLMGLAGTPMESLDQFVTHEVSNHLFEDRNIQFSGMDLPAINIQRGRDHGIRGYNSYREYCKFPRAKHFDDLKDLIPSSLVEELKKHYTHVDDIDLFPGGLVELSVKGGVVGPTFACIIGNQFKRLKQCDRFWYENDNPFTRFTLEQLMEIRKNTLSRLVCDNTDKITTIQKSITDLPDPFLNPRVPCSSFRPFNLELWKEQKRCIIKNTIIEIGSYERISPCVVCVCTKEGVICESLKIDNCYSLTKSHSWDNILKDSVCKVQCSHAFGSQTVHSNNTTYFGFT